MIRASYIKKQKNRSTIICLSMRNKTILMRIKQRIKFNNDQITKLCFREIKRKEEGVTA